MNIDAMPLIRLEVESMKHAIISHLGVHGSELGKILDAEIQKAIDTYPWESSVAEIVHDALHSEIERYFRFGEGRKAIQQSVEESLLGSKGE